MLKVEQYFEEQKMKAVKKAVQETAEKVKKETSEKVARETSENSF